METDALCEALDNGHLFGAALDVTEPEPLPDNHPLWSKDRVIITPHISGEPSHSFPFEEWGRDDISQATPRSTYKDQSTSSCSTCQDRKKVKAG